MKSKTTDHFLYRPIKVNKNVNKLINQYRIFYVMAPLGWGKSTFLKQYVETEMTGNYEWINWEEGFSVASLFDVLKTKEPDLLIIRNFEIAILEDKIEKILEIMTVQFPDTRFALLSCIPIPEKMIPLIVSGEFFVISTKDLKPTCKDVSLYFQKNDVELSELELKKIEKDFNNMPLSIYIILTRIRESQNGYTGMVRGKCMEDIFNYYDVVFFRGLPVKCQDLLYTLAFFDQISERLLVKVLLETSEESKQCMQYLQKRGNILQIDSESGNFRFEPLFQKFLQRYAKKYTKEEQMSEIYLRAILFYIDEKNYVEALKFAGILNDEVMLANILELFLSTHNTVYHYIDLEVFFEMISVSLIRQRPKLITGKAMLAAVLCRMDESIQWFNLLGEIANNDENILKQEEAGGLYSFLFIAMSGHHDDHFLEKLPLLVTKIKYNKLKLPEVLLTANMPSALHGGRDFCNYLTQDVGYMNEFSQLLGPLFGERAAGLYSLFRGEIEYERNHDKNAFAFFSTGLQEAKANNVPEIIFTGTALLSNLMLSNNQVHNAIELWEKTEQYLEYSEAKYLKNNWKAYQMLFGMITNQTKGLENWLAEEAPDEFGQFNTLYRYQFLIKAKAYIGQKENLKAMFILNQLREYAINYKMTYLELQTYILEAVILYRENNISYYEVLEKALKMAEPMRLMRIFADEGAALYPLLNVMSKNNAFLKNEFCMNVLELTKKYKVMYPYYLEEEREIEFLTTMEKEVLRLLELGHKNIEIAKTLFISENTVKYHLKNIYVKLNVTSRSQAINIAREKRII